LLATDDAQDESGAITVVIDSIAGVEDAAAAATVAMLLEAIDEVKEDGDANDLIIWVTATLLCLLPELDAMDDDGSDAKAAMYW